MTTETKSRMPARRRRHLIAAMSLAVAHASALGCGPSIGDLVARRQWRAAIDATSSIEELEEVMGPLRSRVTGRFVARAYTPAELASLLGYVPVELRSGAVFLVASRAELRSPDATIADTEVDVGGDPVACCDNQVAWDALNGRHQPVDGSSSDDSSWLATARDFASLFATPVQTIVGTVRDVTTLATGGGVPNAPVSGPGLDLSVGAILARMGIGGPAAPSPDAEAARAAQEAQARARLHALLAARCDPSADATCMHFALRKLSGPMRHLVVRFAYRFPGDPQPMVDDIRIRQPGGDSLPARLHAMFPDGPRALSDFTWLRSDEPVGY